MFDFSTDSDLLDHANAIPFPERAAPPEAPAPIAAKSDGPVTAPRDTFTAMVARGYLPG